LDLDIDPLEIESWEEYCKLCIKHNQLELFKKKINEFIYSTTQIELNSLNAYVNKRLGEFFEYETIHKKIKNKIEKGNYGN
jgi:hypothetical protein